MSKGRLEAFSDGVLAIIITIMVLELRPPHAMQFEALRQVWPGFLGYLLSFVHLAIYWNNHHHLLQAAKQVSGGILWANMHLLFWLSLVPFATAWMGDTHFAPWPVALYGLVLLLAAGAYEILTRALIRHHGKESVLGKAVGADRKGTASVVLYCVAIASALWLPWLACGIYALIAVIWLCPDPRIERTLSHPTTPAQQDGAGNSPDRNAARLGDARQGQAD